MNIVTLEIIERLEKAIEYRKDIAHRKITFRYVWESKFLDLPIDKIHPGKVIDICENDYFLQTIHDLDISQKQSSSIPEKYQKPIYGDKFYESYLARRPVSEFEMSELIKEHLNKEDTFDDYQTDIIDPLEKTPIECFHTLKFKIQVRQHLHKVGQFCLIGDEKKTRFVELTPNHASLLLYLALERKNSGKNWLTYPEKHITILEKIYKSLILNDIYYYEIKNKPARYDSSGTWIWDFRNNIRRNIITKIHKDFHLACNIEGKLIVLKERTKTRVGNYSLSESIKNIDIQIK